MSEKAKKPRKPRVSKKDKTIKATSALTVLREMEAKQKEMAAEETASFVKNTEGHPPEPQELHDEPPKVSDFLGNDEIPTATQQRELEEELEQGILPEPQVKYVIPEEPTRQQIIAATVDKIAQNVVDETEKRTKKAWDPAKQHKLDSKVKKDFDNSAEFHAKKLELCRKMNAYKKVYQDKIEFPWKKEYTPEMDMTLLEAHSSQIETILNTRHIPGMIKGAMLQITGVLEALSLQFNMPYLNLGGSTTSVTALANPKPFVDPNTGNVIQPRGYFDDEIEQLAIEYADYFQKPPLVRLAQKWGIIVLDRVVKNAPTPLKEMDSKITPQVKEQYSDL